MDMDTDHPNTTSDDFQHPFQRPIQFTGVNTMRGIPLPPPFQEVSPNDKLVTLEPQTSTFIDDWTKRRSHLSSLSSSGPSSASPGTDTFARTPRTSSIASDILYSQFMYSPNRTHSQATTNEERDAAAGALATMASGGGGRTTTAPGYGPASADAPGGCGRTMTAVSYGAVGVNHASTHQADAVNSYNRQPLQEPRPPCVRPNEGDQDQIEDSNTLYPIQNRRPQCVRPIELDNSIIHQPKSRPTNNNSWTFAHPNQPDPNYKQTSRATGLRLSQNERQLPNPAYFLQSQTGIASGEVESTPRSRTMGLRIDTGVGAGSRREEAVAAGTVLQAASAASPTATSGQDEESGGRSMLNSPETNFGPTELNEPSRWPKSAPRRAATSRDPNESFECISDKNCSTRTNPRKALSHFFGRNKTETKRIPTRAWYLQCRKHYQRGKYRGTKKSDYSVRQVKMLTDQVKNFREVMGTIVWTIQYHSKLSKRVEQYSNAAAQQEVPDVQLQGALLLRNRCGANKSTQDVLDFIEVMFEYCKGHGDKLLEVEFLAKKWGPYQN